MKTTMTLKVAATLAALALPLTACTSGPTPDASSTVTTTVSRVADSTTTTTRDYLPDDRVTDSPVETPDYDGDLVVDPTNGDILDSQETGFVRATCELLDEGHELEDLLMANMVIDLPFAPGRIGELMAIAVYVECPQHTRQMESFLGDQGY